MEIAHLEKVKKTCIIPPTVYIHEAPFFPPEVTFYNKVFEFRSPRTMLEKLDGLENPDEEQINKIVEHFFRETFKSYLSCKGTALDYSLQQLLRHKVVDELKWFENHNQLTSLKPLKFLYPHTCCVCLERGLYKSKVMFGEMFDELWDMVWPNLAQDAGDLDSQVETLYNQMMEKITATEVAGGVESLIKDQIKLFQTFFVATLKDGGSAKSAFWECCKHVDNYKDCGLLSL